MTSGHMRAIAFLVLLLATVNGLTGCETKPFSPADFESGSDAQTDRERQIYTFDNVTEQELFAASVSILQDLGFTVNEANVPLGLILAVKTREAKATDQKTALLLLLFVAAMAGGNVPPGVPMHEDQTISATLAIRPVPGKGEKSHTIRVTFHRLVRQPLAMHADVLREAELYTTFKELLSKAIYLEEHKL